MCECSLTEQLVFPTRVTLVVSAPGFQAAFSFSHFSSSLIHIWAHKIYFVTPVWLQTLFRPPSLRPPPPIFSALSPLSVLAVVAKLLLSPPPAPYLANSHLSITPLCVSPPYLPSLLVLPSSSPPPPPLLFPLTALNRGPSVRVDGASGSRMGGGVTTESRVGEEQKAATKALGRGVCMYV